MLIHWGHVAYALLFCCTLSEAANGNPLFAFDDEEHGVGSTTLCGWLSMHEYIRRPIRAVCDLLT